MRDWGTFPSTNGDFRQLNSRKNEGFATEGGRVFQSPLHCGRLFNFETRSCATSSHRLSVPVFIETSRSAGGFRLLDRLALGRPARSGGFMSTNRSSAKLVVVITGASSGIGREAAVISQEQLCGPRRSSASRSHAGPEQFGRGHPPGRPDVAAAAISSGQASQSSPSRRK